MAVQLSVAVRDAQNDAIETAVGTAPILEIRSGSAPRQLRRCRHGHASGVHVAAI